MGRKTDLVQDPIDRPILLRMIKEPSMTFFLWGDINLLID